MRIKSVELKNHINFEDLKIDNLDTADIITLSGANGSGKSFFINTLHPWATSSRYVKSYSIIEGKEGYKRIVFQKNNGDLVEIMHEYMPKKNTHACKSYINIIRDGVRQELNPTGHSEVFKEMCKKHLAFDNNVFEVSCISFKTNGITSSSSTNRKKIMETTLNLDGLKTIKKRASEVNSTYNATMKILESQKIKILHKHDIVSMDSEMLELKDDVDLAQDSVISNTKLIQEYERVIDKFDKVLESDKESLYTAGRLAKVLPPNTLINSVYIQYKKLINEIPLIEKELNDLSIKIKKIDDFNELVNQIDQEEIRVKNAKASHKTQKEEAMKVFCIDKGKYRDNQYLTEICNEFEVVIHLIRQLAELVRSCPIVYATDSIVDLLNRRQENLSRITNFIAKYDMYQSMTDGNDYNVPYASNCDTCSVYDKFVKSSQFIKDNTKQYKDIKMNLSEENREINTIQNIVNITNGWSIGKTLSKYIKDEYLKTIHMDTVQAFITECGNSYEEETRVRNLIAKLKFMIVINDNIDDAVASLNYVKEKKELLGDMSDEKGELINRHNEVTQILASKLDQLSIYKNTYHIDTLNEEIVATYGMTKPEDIIETCKIFASASAHKRSAEDGMIKARRDLEEAQRTIKMSSMKLAELEHEKKEFEDTSESLRTLTIKKQVAQRLREIIEKDIPIMLMMNNLDYIERSVNSILQDNGIGYSIHIVPSDTEIQIEATINGKYIPDVSLLSAGETCIISLLLNASILRILGYNILCLDEIDANLDTVNKRKFSNLIYSIMSVLGIDQVICVSHNITTNIDSAVKLLIGDGEGLDLDTSSMIRIK